MAGDASTANTSCYCVTRLSSQHKVWTIQGKQIDSSYALWNIEMCFQRLYDLSRWDNLIRSFRLAIYTLNTLPTEPLLHLALYAGLASLKLPACYDQSTKNVDCPVCDGDVGSDSQGIGLGKLGEEVPLSHHANSTIVCRISGKIMDEDNMPMAFPNGYVYSREVDTHFTLISLVDVLMG